MAKTVTTRAIARSVPITDLILYLEDMLDQSKAQLKSKKDVPIIYAFQLTEYFEDWGDEWQGDNTMIVNEERKKAVRNLKKRRKRKEDSNLLL